MLVLNSATVEGPAASALNATSSIFSNHAEIQSGMGMCVLAPAISGLL
jgi:hypothetical protein